MPKGKRKSISFIADSGDSPPLRDDQLGERPTVTVGTDKDFTWEASRGTTVGDRVVLTKDTVIKGMTIRRGTIGVVWGLADGRYKVNTKNRTFWTTDIRQE